MFNTKTRIITGMLFAVLFSASAAGSAFAEATTTVCVPERASTSVLSTNSRGECPTKTISQTTVKYKSVALPGAAQLETLNKVLPHMEYIASGVAGKPTIRFSGVNVQVVSGEGSTNGPLNGEGNLVIGYDENERGHPQTGSHNLILGEEQAFTSFGGIVAGKFNTISGEFSSVTGGAGNVASGIYSSVSGGATNTASGTAASVSAGEENTASGKKASVSGGKKNSASELYASVSGGLENSASGYEATVSGGAHNKAASSLSSVSGGVANLACCNLGPSVSGGAYNEVTGEDASISGGDENKASSSVAWIGGGRKNGATAPFTAVLGEKEGTAWREYEAIF